MKDLIATTRRVARRWGVTLVDRVEVQEVVQTRAPLDQDQLTISRLVRRRGAIPTGRRYPISGSCDHCGQPLSDPYSLLIGVGPVCRGYYSPRVLAAVAATRAPLPEERPQVRTASVALQALAREWARG